ncbi:hypothetical protein KAFR_0D00590 [Kazachstania africana CBS 2517]|uniref:FHA domain-containing protein n=1 Tax=Kazachstania africana (strain ATCC 22294 / BCRC 22015 / CBS 2517 / CECT 1963 / NBRC 1671 / NRRL Y-8276) TaxID=1071382 RepID=H2ATK6_KAZAF|nr:hypothetical protein KAFR_0D00590 [Kazachstania africana CBS 2517]CCF57706.1 hypothetical protein KAFR_0D00590 [Kazachstania africana CBS 2517]
MSSYLPPSSPVRGSTYAPSHDYEKKDVSHACNKTYHQTFKDKNSHRDKYPSPFPSSSIGHSSSPIKETIDPDSSFEVESDQNEKDSLKVFSTPIPVEIDTNSRSSLLLGRKRGLCDVLLPPMKTISRKHAIISYIPEKNQVRIECLGINSMIISLPRMLQGHLIKLVPNIDVYELAGTETIRMLEQNRPVQYATKPLVKDCNLTRFCLEKGESIIMPFMNNTTVDFRQAIAILTRKEAESSLEIGNHYDSDSDLNSSEDSLDNFIDNSEEDPLKNSSAFERASSFRKDEIPSIVKSHIPTAPKVLKTIQTHTIPQPIHTPESSFAIREPSTPTKKQPMAAITASVPHSHVKSFRKQNSATPTQSKHNTKRKLTTQEPDEQSVVKKESKKQKKLSEEEILEILKGRNVDIAELQRVLANHLAFANVQQTPLSQLMDVNSTIKNLSKEELRAVLAEEPCIGIIYRQGKDAAGKPLDEEYFYDLEKDTDEERRGTVTLMKGGRTGLRSCRRTHKQYFWKKPARK